MFHHFGVNKFTNSEQGTGKEDPAIFDPVGLDAGQWVSAAEDAGISLMILTAKHHDGFCMWPSRCTEHSAANSRWRSGKGDVVRELVKAAESRGVDVGLCLSPWGQDIAGGQVPLPDVAEMVVEKGIPWVILGHSNGMEDLLYHESDVVTGGLHVLTTAIIDDAHSYQEVAGTNVGPRLTT